MRPEAVCTPMSCPVSRGKFQIIFCVSFLPVLLLFTPLNNLSSSLRRFCFVSVIVDDSLASRTVQNPKTIDPRAWTQLYNHQRK